MFWFSCSTIRLGHAHKWGFTVIARSDYRNHARKIIYFYMLCSTAGIPGVNRRGVTAARPPKVREFLPKKKRQDVWECYGRWAVMVVRLNSPFVRWLVVVSDRWHSWGQYSELSSVDWLSSRSYCCACTHFTTAIIVTIDPNEYRSIESCDWPVTTCGTCQRGESPLFCSVDTNTNKYKYSNAHTRHHYQNELLRFSIWAIAVTPSRILNVISSHAFDG